METTSQPFHLPEDSKSLPQMAPLGPSDHPNHLDDIDQQLRPPPPHPHIQHKYYEQFKKIYHTSYKLWLQVKKQRKLKESISIKICSIQTQLTALHKTRRMQQQAQLQEQNQLQRKANKRTRRTAEQIERKFDCRADFCGRCYGSQGSLQQHIKLKHPELYKKQNDSQEY